MNADEVIVTSGAQQALALTVSVLPEVRRSNTGTYPGALDLFRHAGELVSEARYADVSYVVTGVGNPSGVDITLAERDCVSGGIDPARFRRSLRHHAVPELGDRLTP